ncbi:related to Cerevisin [Zygosaccharomyces bailii]|nr:related to Cerevisin [Zygosaccharomyces bailii]
MKICSSIVPVAALASLGTALVIPELAGEGERRPKEHKGHKGASREHEGLTVKMGKPNSEDVVHMASQLSDEVSRRLAPLVTPRSADVLENRYIVLFRKGVSLEEINFHKELVSQVHLQEVSQMSEDDNFFEGIQMEGMFNSPEGGIDQAFDINGVVTGYAGYFPEKVVDAIRMSPLVEVVEKDSYVYTQKADTENNAPWGLARISHREKLNLGSYNKYLYDSDGGKGVTAYVIDTGVNVNHQQFGGRATWGKTIPEGDDDEDGNGHGTHVAGTMASATYGVAKGADIVAVKVLRSNGSGSMSDVIKGVEWATQAHQEAVKKNKPGFKGSTANMSLGGGKSPTLDLAVNAAVKAGLNFAVAAGNEDQDACNTSPASAEGPITVGASTLSDDRAYFSNWGSCVDVFAPGLNILSTYIGSETATATLSGTSMASPHVAGLLAYFLSLQPGKDSEFFNAEQSIAPDQLKKKLLAFSSKDVLTDIPSKTPNLLIYNGGGGDLKGFWGSKDVAEEFNEKVDLDLHELVENLGSKTDAVFGQIRGLMDRLDII